MGQLANSYLFNGATVRVLGTVENPMFVAKDICDVLGITNTSDAISQLDEDDLGKGEVTGFDSPSLEEALSKMIDTLEK